MTIDTSPQTIYANWKAHPRRHVFVIDETRKDVYDEQKNPIDQLVAFTCLCLDGEAACRMLEAVDDIRQRFPDEIGLRDLKGTEVVRQLTQEPYTSVASSLLEGARNASHQAVLCSSSRLGSICIAPAR